MKPADEVVNSTDVSTKWTAGYAEVTVFVSRVAMAKAAAKAIAAQIRTAAGTREYVRMIFAAAPSQLEMLDKLVNLPGIPWDRVVAFHMDDYITLPAEAPQRFANWLDENLFSKVIFAEVHRIPADGAADKVCQAYAAKLAEAPIDIVCLGIGINGHIAFNDPPVAEFDDQMAVKIVELDEICRQQQVDDACFLSIEDVPIRAITLTIPRLLNADALFCVVPGAHKRPAVESALGGPLTTACPASILRTHTNCKVFLDPESAPND
jgi:glucosamine-6-phosphate deaminase